jgi:hypothetical protein
MTMLIDAKTLIGPPVNASGDYDGLLEDIIAGVLAEADDFMGVSYQAVTDAIAYFDGGKSTLYLPHVNVTVASVEVDGVALSADEFVVYPEAGKIVGKTGSISGFPTATDYSPGRFAAGQRNVKVTYSGGYEEDAYPLDLRRKLLKQVAYEFRRRSDPGLSAVSYPDGTVSKFAIAEWLEDVEAMLSRKRRIFI